MQRYEAALDGLPTGPGSRIIRAAEVKAWEHGLQFHARVRWLAERVEAAALSTYAAERARGYADGRAEGEQEAARLVVETVAAVDRYMATLEQEVAALAISVVRRMIGALEPPDLVARVAARAVLDFRRSKWLKLTVHPDAAERVSQLVNEIIGNPGFCCTVEADASLDPGGCVLASELAVVDAGIETQLAAFAEAFRAMRREAI